ncbi:MAG: 23S rRNA (uracil(1939)-C(5))-methyltransferase RlmD [Bacteroidia bacterium]|nr:23S rRNA (uracil(1939)-C(5))-methyltransferase RlmD [Bacteroidia bacterium]NNF29904.1 23S rRNA (uracil(1939)-C(5))-methyltransferase RlmD [Flavobacteriaceae bacterium]MBT8276888.1 23S rRNA (uracil(1939)-C(5))-methyltransferase RlmD [Bacteroidia bacterium]NNJ81618.1 23S rRNA (uracil(1939)-C(5))-methyltransferase RlmD [Flavobacteriaceae bacterium]NNK55042.1 23S rRNA (uracil(1939)-C(5))-methyltransferase RlmD [Flavobacteriaceae bacterium]
MRKRKKRVVFENIEIIDAGAKGKSVAKAPDGRVIFVNNAVPGDIATIQTFKKRKAYYEGSAISFSHYSDKRIDPVCQHFGTCGGCKWQFMDYTHQLFYKQKEVKNNLTRLGGIELPEVEPIIGSEKTVFYRNKMEFSFSDNKWLTREQIESGEEIENRNALGFHIPGMWDKILDIDECHLQREPSNAIRNFVKDKAQDLGISFFNTRQQHGMLRTLMIRTSTTGDVMVLVQFFSEEKTKREQLLEAIKEKFPEITSLLYVINSKGNDTIYDQQVNCYSGEDHIFEEMEGLRFKINAKSFYQTNSEQAHELYKITRNFAGLTGKELVYDLYTGTGTIAQFVSKQAAKVVGIEAVPEAIQAARENAELNNIKNTEFVVGDMKKVFNDDFVAAHGKPDVIITDPPRDGMHSDVVQQLINLLPERIVYVSCNSATQARDLKMMDEHYRVDKVQPVDMFPQTYHVENVVLLEKRK